MFNRVVFLLIIVSVSFGCTPKKNFTTDKLASTYFRQTELSDDALFFKTKLHVFVLKEVNYFKQNYIGWTNKLNRKNMLVLFSENEGTLYAVTMLGGWQYRALQLTSLNKEEIIHNSYEYYRFSESRNGFPREGYTGLTDNLEFVEYCNTHELHPRLVSTAIQYLLDERKYKIVGSVSIANVQNITYSLNCEEYGFECIIGTNGIRKKNSKGGHGFDFNIEIKDYRELLDKYRSSISNYDNSYTPKYTIPQKLLKEQWVLDALKRASTLKQIIVLKNTTDTVGQTVDDNYYIQKVVNNFDTLLTAPQNGYLQDELKRAEELLYVSALNSTDRLNKYVKRFPSNAYTAQAKEKVFEYAQNSTSKLKSFIAKYPNDKNVQAAKKQLSDIKKEAERKRLAEIESEFNLSKGSKVKLKKFIAEHADSKLVVAAKLQIKEIEAREEAERIKNEKKIRLAREKTEKEERRRIKRAAAENKRRAALQAKKQVGDKVCIVIINKRLEYSWNVTAVVENIDGDDIQLKIIYNDGGGVDPRYKKVKLRRGKMIWDRYDKWKHCN